MQFTTPRKGNKLILNVTSLIDVMFLLLIFFLVTSTFRQQPAIQLDLPASASAENVEQGPAVLTLAEDGSVYLDQQRIGEAELVAALRARQEETGDDRIILRADSASTLGRAVELMDRIKESGFTRISLTARRPDDDKGGRLDGTADAP
jgi:biopolymer transport protein ExbD